MDPWLRTTPNANRLASVIELIRFEKSVYCSMGLIVNKFLEVSKQDRYPSFIFAFATFLDIM